MESRWIEVGAGRGYLAVPESGSGPGLVIFAGQSGAKSFTALADLYAEEGYVTLAVDGGYAEAAKALNTSRETVGQIGAIGFGIGGKHALEAVAAGAVACAAIYYGEGIATFLDKAGEHGRPVMFHFADPEAAAFDRLRTRFPAVECFFYRGVAPRLRRGGQVRQVVLQSPPTPARWSCSAGMLGPRYDLDKIWDRHTELEFGSRDAEETMRTMVPDPYVNHVPAMTGGTGFDEMLRFYKHHFIPTTPKDARLVPISRIMGADRGVDEMLFCFTHDSEIDWMLPGVKPSGKSSRFRWWRSSASAATRSIASTFRGTRLRSWSRLVFSTPPACRSPESGQRGKRFDEHLPSNALMARWKESEGK